MNKLFDNINNSSNLITGHINPDGDALGSALAFKLILDSKGIDSDVCFDIKGNIPSNLNHLPINLILKADTNGSVEAIRDGVNKLATDEVNIQVVHAAVGGIVLSDVDLAGATDSMIIGFNVRPDSQSRNMAQSKGIDVRTYNIIYELLDDISEAVLGQMTIKTEEAVIGMVDVKTTFRAPKVGVVAGSIVSEGKVELDAKARLLRDGIVIYEGTIVSLRRFKDNVEVVNEGLECGIGLSDYKDIKEGDTIEILAEVEV